MGRGELKIQPYYQLENYFKQSETVSKKNNKYKYYDTYADREDYGLLTSLTIPFEKDMQWVCGIDCKQGNVVTEEIYYTSTDLTQKKGQLNQYALYALWQGALLKSKLNLSAGMRYDRIAFRNGAFVIETPSALTSFIENYPTMFTNEDWGALSPKLSARYSITKNTSIYVSYAIGYRPPMLDDMCTNRSVTKGFKIANTQLAPEYLHNYELGGDAYLTDKVRFETSLYHAIGKGFHYFVGTGDSVDTGGDALKPVLIRDNIAEVKIYGVETALEVSLMKNLRLRINHAYNYSYISSFENDKYKDKSLEGKLLMEVPDHTVNTSLQYTYKDFTAYLSFHYVGRQWIDDENTTKVPAYNYINFRITTPQVKFIKLGIEVDNILNRQFLNNKGQWCPGRYFQFDLIFNY
ncbi:MAG: catecholate siderophore receptor CirA [Bacteroidetes bacterium ADurb.Bin408]|nr:MAG: catecholate siderophore receptor CirA [Bacteroidetes bacterium ADurb.Bin408]